MATQSYQHRSDSTPRTSAPNLGRPFVLPAVQTKADDSSEQVQAAPDQSVSLLTNRYQVSAAPAYQPNWIARAQTTPETAEPEETEEKVEETVQRSIDGAPPEAPSDPADDPEDNPVQAKLTIGQPNDRYEQEADRVAEQVMSMPDTAVQRQVDGIEETEAEETEAVQTKPLADTITPMVQRQPKRSKKPNKNHLNLEHQLNSTKGQGSPLAKDVRSFMEPRFGVDFSQVRVHTGGQAAQMNKKLGAKAFAHGGDLYFGSGYQPKNDALMAHELTHIVQQTGPKKLPRPVNNRNDKKLKTAQPDGGDRSNKTATPQNNVGNSAPSNKSADIHSATKPPATPEKSESVKTAKAFGNAVKNNFVSFLTKQTNPEKVEIPEAPAVKAGEAPAAVSYPANPAESAGPGAAIETEGPASQEAEAPETAEDPELAKISQETEALPSEEKAAAAAELDAIGAEGGEAPAPMGGGGGGVAIPEKPQPPAPNISASSDPVAAMASIAKLPPAQMQVSLGTVGLAINHAVGQEKADTAKDLPEIEVGGDSAATATAIPVSTATPKPVAKAKAGAAKPTPAPKPLPTLPALPKTNVRPQVQGGTDGKLSSQDVQNLKTSLNSLPKSDPSAAGLKAANPPSLKLEGNANPQQAQEQRAKLESSLNQTQAQGQKDAAQSLGEDQIKATVPKEMIKADPTATAEGAAAPVAGKEGGGTADMTISLIAQEKSGPEIQAAVSQAQGQMGTERQGYKAKVSQEKQKSQADIEKLKASNTQEQEQEKLKAQTEADTVRSQWTQEQDQLVNQLRQEADVEVSKGNEEIQTQQSEAEQKAQTEIEAGNQKAEIAHQEGEKKAQEERQKGEKESSGFFGWVADKATAFFDGIKKAVEQAFEAARAAIKAAIETAQKLAMAAIEAGRKAIVSVIRRVGDALIALGDKLLANFPQLRDRFRKLIQDKVKQAEAAVNRIADNLKKTVKAALDLLAKGLDAALGLLQKGLTAAVDIANKAVQTAISTAKALVDALGTFAVLVKDVASSPGQWISNLAAGVMDGIKNHLWTAFQSSIKEWFNQKLEEVLGLGLTVWTVLKQNGFDLAKVGQIAWEGLKSAIPPALIQILLEKVVSMIVPAAGTIMLIIEGLQAAWGTASRILQAIEKFVGFLKAVKSGNSGPMFGQMLASAGVAVVDFVSNWLLRKVRGTASKIAGKIKAIAKKIGSKLKAGAGKLKDKFKAGAGKLKNRLKTGAGKLKDKLKNGTEKLKNKLKNGTTKLKEKTFGVKDNDKNQHDEKTKKNKDQNSVENKDRKNREILERAERELTPKIQSALHKGVSGIRLRAQLAIWRIQHKLTALSIENQGSGQFKIIAKVNPSSVLSNGVLSTDEQVNDAILQVMHKIGVDTVEDHGKTASLNIQEQRTQGRGTKNNPIQLPPGGNFGAMQDIRNQPEDRPMSRREYTQFSQQETAVSDHRAFGSSKFTPGTLLVSVGKKTPSYPEIAEELQHLKKTTQATDQEIAEAIRNMSQGKPLPKKLISHNQTIGELARLLLHVEGSRGKSAPLMGPMLLDLIGRGEGDGKMTFDKAFSGGRSELTAKGKEKFGGGEFPPSQVGAVKSMGVIGNEVDHPDMKRSQAKSILEQRKRQIELAKNWIRIEMKSMGMLFDNKNDLINFLQNHVEEKLRAMLKPYHAV
jgi:hypothetical protein